MSKNQFVLQNLYGMPLGKDIGYLKLSSLLKTSIIYDLPYLNDFSFNKISQYDCVYFDECVPINTFFLDYLKTCTHTHISLYLNPKMTKIELSNTIQSMTIIGIDKHQPLIHGNNLKSLYLSGFESTSFYNYDWLPKTVTELGLIDSCWKLNIPQSCNLSKVVLISSGCQIESVPNSVKQIIFCPLYFCESSNKSDCTFELSIPKKYEPILHISNPENLKTYINIKFIDH